MKRAVFLCAALAVAIFSERAAAQNVAAPPAAQQVEAPVLARPVALGEPLSPADFTSGIVAANSARTAIAPDAVMGMEAARNLAAGAVVRRSDIRPQQLVRRGEPVTVRVVREGLSIATTGRALSNGGRGDFVRVVVDTTSRTIDAMVDGSGSVRVTVP